jgi:hypothetical protein
MNQTELKQFIEKYQNVNKNNKGEFGIFYHYHGPVWELAIDGEKFVNALAGEFIHFDELYTLTLDIDAILKLIKKEHGDKIITDRQKLIITDEYGNIFDAPKGKNKGMRYMIGSVIRIYEIVEEDPGFTYLGFNPNHVLTIEWVRNKIHTLELMYLDMPPYYRLIRDQKKRIAGAFINELKIQQNTLDDNLRPNDDSRDFHKQIANKLPNDIQMMMEAFMFGDKIKDSEPNKKLKMDEEEEDDEDGGVCVII